MKLSWMDLPAEVQTTYLASYRRILERLAQDGYLVQKAVDLQESQVIHPWMWEAAEIVLNAPRRKVTTKCRRRLRATPFPPNPPQPQPLLELAQRA